jgi:hypothetical protein
MTVRELVKILTELPEDKKDFEILTQGCDCDGDVGKVTVYKEYVYLERS